MQTKKRKERFLIGHKFNDSYLDIFIIKMVLLTFFYDILTYFWVPIILL